MMMSNIASPWRYDTGAVILRSAGIKELTPHLSGEQVDQAVVIARTIKPKGLRGIALAELASQLSGDQLDRVLGAARAIESSDGLSDLLVEVVDPGTRVRKTRQLLVAILDEKIQGSCSEVLKALEVIRPGVLGWTIVGLDTVAALVRHIIEIRHRWRWL
jgi:hypothetical protein